MQSVHTLWTQASPPHAPPTITAHIFIDICLQQSNGTVRQTLVHARLKGKKEKEGCTRGRETGNQKKHAQGIRAARQEQGGGKKRVLCEAHENIWFKSSQIAVLLCSTQQLQRFPVVRCLARET